MQLGIIYKSAIGCWMLSSFAFIAVAAERSNPWALPQASMAEDWRQTDRQHNRNQPPPSNASQSKFGRFVTPEILDSLKRQQTQMQLMPGQTISGQMMPGQHRVEPAGSCPVLPKDDSILRPQLVSGFGRMPQSSYYSGQSVMLPRVPAVVPSNRHYGMNSTNPMFDSPAVSPWGNGADVLYRGESFPNTFPGSVPSALGGQYPGMSQGAYPWMPNEGVPNEALGGLLPIPVPSSVEDSYQRETPLVTDYTNTGNIEKAKVDNVFNPFTFLPGDSLR